MAAVSAENISTARSSGAQKSARAVPATVRLSAAWQADVWLWFVCAGDEAKIYFVQEMRLRVDSRCDMKTEVALELWKFPMEAEKHVVGNRDLATATLHI